MTLLLFYLEYAFLKLSEEIQNYRKGNTKRQTRRRSDSCLLLELFGSGLL